MDGGGGSRLGFLWPPREILLDSRRDASLTPNSNPFYSMGTGSETPSSAQPERESWGLRASQTSAQCHMTWVSHSMSLGLHVFT